VLRASKAVDTMAKSFIVRYKKYKAGKERDYYLVADVGIYDGLERVY